MTEQKPILYGFFRSSAAWRVRLALEWKGIDYDTIYLNLATGEHKNDEYKKVNPSLKLPTFVTKNGDKLTQSLAILEYLEEVYPEREMLPKNKLDRAKAREIANIIACDIHPLQNSGILQRFCGSDLKERTKLAQEMIVRGFTALEAHLENTAGKYCVGDDITIADFCLVPQVYNAKRYEVDLTAFPIITRIYNTLLTLPEFRKTHPHNQEDCTPELKAQGII